jgi:hypothetical protein
MRRQAAPSLEGIQITEIDLGASQFLNVKSAKERVLPLPADCFK